MCGDIPNHLANHSALSKNTKVHARKHVTIPIQLDSQKHSLLFSTDRLHVLRVPYSIFSGIKLKLWKLDSMATPLTQTKTLDPKGWSSLQLR